MDEGDLEACVYQLLSHLEALNEAESKDLSGAVESAQWCVQRYDELEAEFNALPPGSPDQPRIKRRLDEANKRLLFVLLRYPQAASVKFPR